MTYRGISEEDRKVLQQESQASKLCVGGLGSKKATAR